MTLALAVCATGMAMSNYHAKSDMVDTTAPGGFSGSTNASWSMADVALSGRGVTLVVKKNQCCGPNGECAMILSLANGTGETLWLNASDSRLHVIRQARDAKGEWRPVEFRVPADCGNSHHRVALNAGRAFVWDVPSTSGSLVSKSRYVLYGLEKPVYSNEFDSKLPTDAFDVPADYIKDYSLGANGMLVRR